MRNNLIKISSETDFFWLTLQGYGCEQTFVPQLALHLDYGAISAR